VLQNTSHHGFLHLKLQKKHSGLSPAQFLPLIWLAHNPNFFKIWASSHWPGSVSLFIHTSPDSFQAHGRARAQCRRPPRYHELKKESTSRIYIP
jgi:hypothetical protein